MRSSASCHATSAFLWMPPLRSSPQLTECVCICHGRPNRVKFGELHGYSILNASSLLSGTAACAIPVGDVGRGCGCASLRWDVIHLPDERPPSWSKILAVQNHLPEYTWILWMDADSIITNMQVKVASSRPMNPTRAVWTATPVMLGH